MGCVQSPDAGELSPSPRSPKFSHISTQSNNNIVNVELDTPTINDAMITWQYLEDINENKWKAYPSNISFEINQCYQEKGKLSKCQIQDSMLPEPIEIDFEVMLETNVISGWQRKVRMKPNKHQKRNAHNENGRVSVENPLLSDSDMNAINNNNNNNKYEFVWQWYSESNGWKDYDNKLSFKIDSAYRSNLSKYAFKIRSSNVKYEINFIELQQCNLDTRKYRDIRRHKLVIDGDDSDSSDSEYNDDDLKEFVQERFVWEYYNHNDGKWKQYSDNISLKIETVFQAKAGIARMKIHGNPFEVRLDDKPMNHCNLKTNEIYELRRSILTNERHNSSLIMSDKKKNFNKKNKKNNYLWKYKNGFNNWKSYPSKLNKEIEFAYRAENDSFCFEMNGFDFEIEFLFLKQTNLNTNEEKQIARIDDSVQRRTKSVYHNKKSNHNNNNNKKKRPKKQKRSQSIANVSAAKAKKFDTLIEQQNKALKFYEKKRKESVNDLILSQQINNHKLHDSNEEDSSNLADELIKNSNSNSNSNSKENPKFVWKYQDAGIWYEYARELNAMIDNAFKNGDSTVEINKDDGICEIRFDLQREIHFATNRLRQIERHEKKSIRKAHTRSMSAAIDHNESNSIHMSSPVVFDDDSRSHSVFVDPKIYQSVFESPVVLDDEHFGDVKLDDKDEDVFSDTDNDMELKEDQLLLEQSLSNNSEAMVVDVVVGGGDDDGEDIVDEFALLSTGLDALSPPNFGDEQKILNVVDDDDDDDGDNNDVFGVRHKQLGTDYDQYMKKFMNYQHSVTDLST